MPVQLMRAPAKALGGPDAGLRTRSSCPARRAGRHLRTAASERAERERQPGGMYDSEPAVTRQLIVFIRVCTVHNTEYLQCSHGTSHSFLAGAHT
jgi:hypothetical protein